jgi:rod shape-determining protein MreB and related proteins
LKLVAELGIDLGTSNIRVYRRGKGIVFQEPTVVAMNTHTKKVMGVGTAAREMLGRTPGNIQAVRPLRDGVIADYTVTYKMLESIKRLVLPGHQLWLKPNALISVPSGVTNVERRAVIKAALSAGFGKVTTIDEPMAAAIGCGLPISEAVGHMVVNLGGGTTDIAVISLGGPVLAQSVRVGGQKLDDAIIRFVRQEYNLLIGDQTAEEIKLAIGSAYPLEQELSMDVRGRDAEGGLPRTVTITSMDVRNATEEPIRLITDRICDVLEDTPPELSGDIIERGMTLTGGTAMLRGLDLLINALTNIPTRVAENAETAVAMGTGYALDELSSLSASGAVSRIP